MAARTEQPEWLVAMVHSDSQPCRRPQSTPNTPIGGRAGQPTTCGPSPSPAQPNGPPIGVGQPDPTHARIHNVLV